MPSRKRLTPSAERGCNSYVGPAFRHTVLQASGTLAKYEAAAVLNASTEFNRRFPYSGAAKPIIRYYVLCRGWWSLPHQIETELRCLQRDSEATKDTEQNVLPEKERPYLDPASRTLPEQKTGTSEVHTETQGMIFLQDHAFSLSKNQTRIVSQCSGGRNPCVCVFVKTLDS